MSSTSDVDNESAGVPPRLTVVTIGAHDVAGLSAFYERLGWQCTRFGDEFARLHTEGATLTLYRMELLAAETGAGEREPGQFPGITLALNVETEAGVDLVFAAAVAAGATVMVEPVAREWGGRSGYLADPEGNVWEIAWMPGSGFERLGAMTWP